MHKFGITLIAIATATAPLSGCGGNSSSGTTSAGKQARPATAPAKATGGKLVMQMGEMFFRPKAVTAAHGSLRVTERNVGQTTHEFILVRSSTAPGSLPAPGGRLDEKQLDVMGEIADVAAGQSKSKTFALKPGKYIYICNVPGHYSAGMYGGLTVR
jgi:uncharacterized cupredoxin-like copper-binding protein